MIEPNPPMDPMALSQEERSYLLGLYLTDGHACKEGRKESRGKIYYFFQPNEGEIAERVVKLLARASLKPHVYHYGNTIRVAASSKNLDEFYPDKAALSEDASARRRFFEGNDLVSNLQSRIAFCAGLLDGDGTCKARFHKVPPANRNKRLSRIGCFHIQWSFYQIKYHFLVHYFRDFVESLAPDSIGFAYREGMLEATYIRRRGREALIKAGIANWSWKVRKCIESIPKLLEERRRVREKEELERAKEIGEVGMKLKDVAKTLGLQRKLLAKWHCRGAFCATLVREGTGIGYLVIPWEEVKRLKLRVGRAPQMVNIRAKRTESSEGGRK
ncbi:MAG: hypothetical protein WED05_05285 [Candidatus Atabeyarchaeum deiterrae]